eukprot:TRINITY_DN16855_c0_g1_i1.p1 TRINITY_DN16855_c0_g1~~TRINITY_DN16855_c0_g1_i1.p1  ORF type:complete len:235 (-),score=74.67 TRINITY_DN16855_c0_g1_i1:346-1050(-)
MKDESAFDKLEFLLELQEIKDENGEKNCFGEENRLKEALEKRDLSSLIDERKATPLHKAFMNKDKNYEIEKIKFLIENKCDINQVDVNEQTPFHIAFKKNGEYPMEILKEFKEYDVNLIDDTGSTILHIACENNESLKVIKYLVNERQMNFKLKNIYKFTPFINSIQKEKNEEIMKFFIEEMNCDLNYKSASNDNILHLLCMAADKPEILKLLVEKKCDINHKNEMGEIPLHKA